MALIVLTVPQAVVDKKPNIPIYDGYQVSFAAAIKQVVDIPVAAVGLLDNPDLCEYLCKPIKWIWFYKAAH